VILYRATTDSIARQGAHFTEHLEDAVAYTDNPGFGGSTVYSYRVSPRNALEVGDREDLAEAYLDLLDDDQKWEWDYKLGEPPTAHLLARFWQGSGLIFVFHVLEHLERGVPDVEEVLADKYDWISYPDDFPAGSTTWKYLGTGSLKPDSKDPLHRRASASRVALRFATARGKTLWHITKDRNFRPDPDFRPVSGGGWDTARKPMIYATTSPLYWHRVSGGGEGPWTKGRAWAAELELLPGHPPVKRENPLRPQTILDPEFVRVKRVIPVEHAIAEETGYLGNEYVGGDYIYGKTAAPFVDEGMVGEDWGSSASGLLVTDGDRVLLLKRSPYVQDPGLWGIPGGAVPVDYDTGKRKDAKKSALDEAREEMRGIPSGSVVGKHVFRKPSGFSFTTFVWETDPDSLDQFTPRLNWEHTDWKVEDIGDVGSGTHPGVVWVLKKMGPGRVARRAGREHYPGQVDKGKLNAFMSDYKGMTYPPFMQDMRIWTDDPKDPDAPFVMTELKPFDGYISFHAIYSPDKQGAGLASGVIKKLTAIADKHGVSMTLDAKPFSTIDNQLKKSDLIGWYKRHGWIRRPDYGDSSSMIRYPGGSRTPPARTASFTHGRA